MKIERFEGVLAWQEARKLVKMIYSMGRENNDFCNDYKFRGQMNNAAVSIMSNIAEGFSRHSNKEFIQFLFVAKGSAAEVQSNLYVALDQKYISKESFENAYEQADKVARFISNFITYLLQKGNKHN
ncbi:MAG: four helix bundle protein [Candidatus Omnitrophota bacterium]